MSATTQIRMKTLQIGPRGKRLPDQVYDVPVEEAKGLVGVGSAEYVQDSKAAASSQAGAAAPPTGKPKPKRTPKAK